MSRDFEQMRLIINPVQSTLKERKSDCQNIVYDSDLEQTFCVPFQYSNKTYSKYQAYYHQYEHNFQIKKIISASF